VGNSQGSAGGYFTEPVCLWFSHFLAGRKRFARESGKQLIASNREGGTMSGLKRLYFVLLLATWPARTMTAQEKPPDSWQYRVEVNANIGAGSFYHGEARWGSGLEYGGGLGVRPFRGWLRRLGFELQMTRHNTTTEVPGYKSEKLDSRMIMGNVLYHFRSGSRIQPYVLAGIGRMKVDYAVRCVSCLFTVDPITGQSIPIPSEYFVRDTKTGIGLGGGVKFAITRHISIRPELVVVDTTLGSGWNWNWLKSQVGIGFHF
jgi:opacity protein-like surface antigen